MYNEAIAQKKRYHKLISTEKGRQFVRDRAKRYYHKSSGRLRILSYCSRYYRGRRRKLDRLKSKPCLDCGGWFEPCQMQYDHGPGEIKMACVGNLWDGSMKKILEEIRKCDLVCANCHALRTYRRLQQNDKYFSLVRNDVDNGLSADSVRDEAFVL